MKRTWIYATAIMALLAGCGGTPSDAPKPSGWETVAEPFVAYGDVYATRVFRYPVPGGWMYMTMFADGAVATTFVPTRGS